MTQFEIARPDPTRIRLVVSMPLLFRPKRLVYWYQQIQCFYEMSLDTLHLIVITNTFDPQELQLIKGILDIFDSPGFSYEIHSFWNSEDPKAMTWQHKSFIEKYMLIPTGFSHFIYLEDDIRFSWLNFSYWLTERKTLDKVGLLPSFIRYEFHSQHRTLTLTDCVQKTPIDNSVITIGERSYFTPDNPYCAMYVLDRELAKEYVKSRSFDPEQSMRVTDWPSTERSAMGLCFEAIPAGRIARVVVPLSLATKRPELAALIHHLPNNFANGETPTSIFPFGSLKFVEGFT